MSDKHYYVLLDKQKRPVGYVSDDVTVHHIAALYLGGFTVELNKAVLVNETAPIEQPVAEHVDY